MSVIKIPLLDKNTAQPTIEWFEYTEVTLDWWYLKHDVPLHYSGNVLQTAFVPSESPAEYYANITGPRTYLEQKYNLISATPLIL
jgi:hypothetical protein